MFQPKKVRAFRFVAYSFDEETATAHLDYALDEQTFREEITFPGTALPLDAPRRAALQRALRILHWIAGVSYYKAALPPEILVETEPLSTEEASFLDTLYLHGLGELAFRNGLDLRERIRFPSGEDMRSPAEPISLRRRTAVPVGGGKDSIVTLELLREAGEPLVLLSVGNPKPIRETAAVSGIEHLVVRRKIDPALIKLNSEGAINGHVPISAILAAIFAVAAITEDFDVVALSNERSADDPNLVVDGFAVNHQYSKSSAFERDFQALTARELPGFLYFSFLRPLTELRIAMLFGQVPKEYHRVFRSCNTAFKIDESKRSERWCLECPKCRFVFLILARFLPKDEIVAVFGKNLLDDPAQEQGYREMLGMVGHKPFECVGEAAECVAALFFVRLQKEWARDAIVDLLVPELLRSLPESAEFVMENALAYRGLEDLPMPYQDILGRKLSTQVSMVQSRVVASGAAAIGGASGGAAQKTA